MRILAAFDKCKDSLSAREICALAQKVVSKQPVTHEIECAPLTDGGEGFAQLLTERKSGTYHSILASDSIGEEKEVRFGIVPFDELEPNLREFADLPDHGSYAVIEMSSISGLSDLPLEKRNPWLTSTVGVGQLLAGAASLKVSAIILGIGGSATNDMGLGALSSLGMRFLDQEKQSIYFPNPESWGRILAISPDKLVSLPPIRIACDVTNQLLGEGGATFQFGLQKGLSISRRDEMENNMEIMSARLAQIFQKPLDFREEEGTGAAGGIGYGLSVAYDTKFVPGFSFVAKWFGLEKSIQQADLILTGEGRFDQTSLMGKGPYEIIRMASKYNKNVILLAGSVDDDAKKKCMNEFSNLKIETFGNDQFTLEENLLNASDLFQQKLYDHLSINQ